MTYYVSIIIPNDMKPENHKEKHCRMLKIGRPHFSTTSKETRGSEYTRGFSLDYHQGHCQFLSKWKY
ncbi:hypothetical protein [Hazenella coriacea]|uniref:hypothetical protein n=1 Tax=Hazenella coriacea TaxID=1179467 RepID=UPI001FB21F51|nr:hypothetical protein [Hazenella coriacea]